jgi:sugar lactone lactonase YvrE
MRNRLLSRVKSGFLAKFLPATLILAAAPAMVAQSSPIVFTGLETYNWGTGGGAYSSVIGLTTDPAGNLYVSEPSQTRIRIVTPAGVRGPYLNTGAKQPKGMVVDLTNNLWYTDSRPVSGAQGTTITKHPLDGSAEVSISGFNDPISITVDSANNLYVVNQGNNTVQKVTAGVVSTFISGPTLPVQARGIAIDNNNNMYVGDVSGNKVYHYDATTGAFINTLVPAATCEVRDLAVNGAGDLFVGCQTTPSTIYRVPFEVTALNVAHESLVSAVGMSAGVHGLTFGNGILFAANGTDTVDKIQIDAVDVGSFAITPDQTLATSVTMTFVSISDTSIPLSAVQAFSEGIAQSNENGPADYQLVAPASGANCATLSSLGPINSGSATCSVKVNFLPNGVGPRHGAVVFNTGSVAVFTQPVAGVGLGSRVAYGLNTPQQNDITAGGVSLSLPAAIVTDGGGNRFIADTGNNRVIMFAQGSLTGNVVGSGFVLPIGIAVDAAGNLYVSDAAFGISVIPNENGTLNTAHQSVITSAVQFPTGIRFDKFQSLYIADSLNNRIIKLPYEDGKVNGLHQTVVGTGFTNPEGVYPDASGNAWVADTAFDAQELTGGRIVKVAPDGTQTTVPINTSAIPGGLGYPTDVVLDQAGDIYISDTNNYRLLYVSADGSIQTTIFSKQDTVQPGFGAFGGLWIDPVGTLYITDSLNNLLVQIDDGTFDLAFPVTNVGGTSAPLSIQTSNIGNQPLTLESLTFPTDFQQSPVGSSPVLDCAASAVLQGGQSCVIGVAFKPTSSGAKAEPLAVVNTDLNSNLTPFNTDTFILSGTATGTIGLSPSSLTFPVTIDNVGPFTPQNITVTNTGAVATVITVSLGAGSAADYHITSSTCGVSIPVNGSCVVGIAFHPTAGSGVRTGTLVATNSASNTVSASLTGTATTGSLTTVPFGLSFTSPDFVPSATQTFSVFNYTGFPLAISFSNANYFVLTSNCTGFLAARTGSCVATVYFYPTIVPFPKKPRTINRTLTVTGTPTTGTKFTTTVALTGIATPLPAGLRVPAGKLLPNAHVALSTSTLSFAPQATASVSAAKTFTVTNQTGLTSAVSLTVPTGYTAMTSCTDLLNSGESCTVKLAFSPEKPGVIDGVVTTTLYPVDGSDTHTSTVTVRGTGK